MCEAAKAYSIRRGKVFCSPDKDIKMKSYTTSTQLLCTKHLFYLLADIHTSMQTPHHTNSVG
jgi:hypothetical protein